MGGREEVLVMAYIPGRSVIPQLLVRRERWAGGYKTKGTPLVYPGQRVQPNQPVIRLDKWESVEAVPTVPLQHTIDSSLSDAARRGSEMTQQFTYHFSSGPIRTAPLPGAR